MARPDVPVLVIGAGVGGLASAIELAAAGLPVTVIEKEARVGGKMRQLDVGGFAIDSGPTVFTMRWVFDGLFQTAGTSVEELLDLAPANVLARHAWCDGSRLDLYAAREASEVAIREFAGAREAAAFARFCDRSDEMRKTLTSPFMAAERPGSSAALLGRVGLKGIPALLRTMPFSKLWGALGGYFRDPRLRQLFGRYATYVGSSPFRAPATLMVIAAVEQQGVWQVGGGMHAVAKAMRDLAEKLGVVFRLGETVKSIEVERGRASGVMLTSGEKVQGTAVVFNGDSAALSSGLLGNSVVKSVPRREVAARSLSAVTWAMTAKPKDFPLSHHNVFFGDDYRDEFASVFDRRTVTAKPTVYLCAQAQTAFEQAQPGQAEPMLALINAPADGDHKPLSVSDEQLWERAADVMAQCGLGLEVEKSLITTPTGFDALFPGSGGALYGSANHGSTASFARPTATTPIEGLYLAGGTVHPGAGVPMATLSGRLAAGRLLADRAVSKARYVTVASR